MARQGDPGQSKFIVTEEDLRNKTNLRISDLPQNDNRKITDYVDISAKNIQDLIDSKR